MSEAFEHLKQQTNMSYEQILSKLLENKDIALKTHLTAPLEISLLQVIAQILKDNNFPLSAKVIDNFVQWFMEDMTSYNRGSRIEITQAVAGLRNQETNKPPEVVKA